MEKTTVVLVTLVIYKLLLVAVGIWAQRRVSNEEDFFLGGRGLGPLVAAISYSASSSSAWTLLGMSGAAFVMGISAIWLVIGAIVGMLVAWFYVGPRLMHYSREHNLMTLTDFLVHGVAGPWRSPIVWLASLIVVFCFSFYVSAQFQGAGTTFNQTFSIGIAESIILGGVIIMIYTFLGGFWAVSVTDTIQGLLMAFAALVLPIAAYIEVGGYSGFITGLQAVSTPAQLNLTGANAGLAAVGFVLGTFSVALGTFGQPHLLVRFMALRDANAMRQARLMTIAWFAVVFGGMWFVGLAGHILVPDLANPEYVFFALTDSLFSDLIAAVLVAAVLSAIMSTADSQLLVGASAVAHDMGLNRRFPGRSLLISRITISLLVVVAIAVAIFLPATIFDRALLAWSALGASFGPLVVLRVIGVRVTSAGIFYGMATGFSLAVLFNFNPGQLIESYLFNGIPNTVYERVVSFLGGLTVLLCCQEKRS